MNMPKVSVIIPVFNARLYLVEALDSIIAQTFSDWELIIINDGSTDGSKDIIDQYQDKRIKYIENDTNLGLIASLNKAIDFCSGEYIARMDADDIAMPDRLRKQVEFLNTHPDYVLCGTNALVINNSGEQIGKIRNLTDNKYLQINLLFSDPFIHPSMMIRRSALTENKYNPLYKHVEDYELWCRIAKLGKIANIKDDLLKYRWHDTNVSVVYKDEQLQLKDKILCEQLYQFDLIPTAEELSCHKITFQLYAMGQRKQVSSLQVDEVSQWFAKLIKLNKAKGIYEQLCFIAFVWSRWIVLCISQKKYSKMLTPAFASYNPLVLVKLVTLLLYLRTK